ncbi:hypothetical protein CLV51_1152 [Chitinophaga niastensis]|uniref:DUF6896 domain-containing protein n=1 Tax=Chitinophaga niastensis TaxID=536980 RepID=A0A2P8H7X2_CHINA|nr:hypothetical protein [Chitinophaga niastensis]PSL42294.1 hypothetical protein CLV51_1152 [Chitinophaga niastensis]
MEEVERYIYHFLQYVKTFHQFLVNEYNMEGYPSYNEAGKVFPRSGMFNIEGESFNYRYHGSGCTLMVDEVVIDYDLDILSENKIKISDWKFNRFIESYSKGTSKVLIDDLDKIFIQLVKKGVLEHKDPNILVFIINENFFQDYKL